MAQGCRQCPRSCDTARNATAHGFCGVPDAFRIARIALHPWEEPSISGTRGSGTVFFSGCNLRCVFCQNREISHGTLGKQMTDTELADAILRLQDEGAHNVNLVTPSHYADRLSVLLQSIKPRLRIPVVYNSSGYESVETLRQLEGLVQVYLPDFKYADAALAARYSAAPDYPQVALAAIREMFRQTGPFEMDDDGMLRRGVLIRHLILPDAAENTLRVIDAVEDNLPPREILFSLMSQYTPPETLPAEFVALRRRITQAEYDRCADYLDFSDIEYGYFQSPESATDELLPVFDGTGVK